MANQDSDSIKFIRNQEKTREFSELLNKHTTPPPRPKKKKQESI